ncbi:hypothetical protein OBK08_03725 [Empedobacter falsenii]
MINKITFPSFRSTEAEYIPNEFSIYIYNFRSDEVIGKSKRPYDKVNVTRLLSHEIRHYTDHISTFWGLNYIVMNSISMNMRIEEESENYNYLYDFHTLNKKLFYNEYYTKIIPNSHLTKYAYGDDPWKFEITIINKFDNKGLPNKTKPLLSISFYKSINNPIFLSKVPISIISLFEVNAVYEELCIKAMLLNTLPEDEKIVESKLFEKEIFEELIYNNDLVIYNVIVHLTSTILNITDLMEALSVASKIGTLALNLMHEDIVSMKICDFIKNYNDDSDVYIEGFINNHDEGFIFLNLLFNYKDSFSKSRNYNLDEILLSNNLRSKDLIIKSINKEFDIAIMEILKTNNFRITFSDQISKGKEIFNIKGIDGSGILSIDYFNDVKYKPFVIFKDADFPLIDISQESFIKNRPYLKDSDHIEYIQYSDFYVKEMLTEFINACDL